MKRLQLVGRFDAADLCQTMNQVQCAKSIIYDFDNHPSCILDIISLLSSSHKQVECFKVHSVAINESSRNESLQGNMFIP